LGSHLNLIPEGPERCGASMISESVWQKLLRARFLIGWSDSIYSETPLGGRRWIGWVSTLPLPLPHFEEATNNKGKKIVNIMA